MESLEMLKKYLDKIDLSDPSVLSKLKESKPPRWEGDFTGIQPLIYKGLKSSESLDNTLDVLHRLTPLPNNDLVGDGNRLLFAIWANVPFFLRQYSLKEGQKESEDRARQLADVAENQGCARLADCLVAYAGAQYLRAEDFLNDIVTSICDYYFPDQDVHSLVFLMGLLTNNTTWFRIETMKILCVVISIIDMSRADITCHGPDLIAPLLRLLHTELCPQALEVLDHIMTVTGIPMERHHLRMSMASATSSRAIRKEFERVHSLYGIPEPTGWSIPIPAAQSSTTRNNVHAVFYSCCEADGLQGQETTSPEIGFQVDDYGEPYFAPLRADTMKSTDTQPDANMSDLLLKLDSFDDFFADADISQPSPSAMSGSTLHAFTGPDYQDASAYLYDQQTAPLLRQSLGRTASSSSFHNGLAESRPPPSRVDTSVVHPSPLSGANNSMPSLVTRNPSHARSVTSPNNYFAGSAPATATADGHVGGNYIPQTFLSDSDELEDAVSDTDDRMGFNSPPQPPYGYHHHHASTSTPGLGSSREGPFEAMRSGMRRLTGGTAAGRERDRQRDLLRAQQRAMAQTAASPRVPRVPAEYLPGNHGASGLGAASAPTSPDQS
jgi:hypothetical protein